MTREDCSPPILQGIMVDSFSFNQWEKTILYTLSISRPSPLLCEKLTQAISPLDKNARVIIVYKAKNYSTTSLFSNIPSSITSHFSYNYSSSLIFFSLPLTSFFLTTSTRGLKVSLCSSTRWSCNSHYLGCLEGSILFLNSMALELSFFRLSMILSQNPHMN